MCFNITHNAIKFDVPWRIFMQNYLVSSARMHQQECVSFVHLNTMMFSWQKMGQQWSKCWRAVSGMSVHCCALNKPYLKARNKTCLKALPLAQARKCRAPGHGLTKKDHWELAPFAKPQNRERLCRNKMESLFCLIGGYELLQSGLVA